MNEQDEPNQTSVEIEDKSELPTSIGMIEDDDGEVTSENFRDWLREHWVKDIERRWARRQEIDFWNVVGFEKVEVEDLVDTGFQLWRKRDDPPE